MMARFTIAPLLALVACGSSSPSRSTQQYEAFECPAPIGPIVREDCSVSALRYDGVAVSGSASVGPVGAGAEYREHAIREAGELVSMLKEQRVSLCNDFNTCKLTVDQYRADKERLDDSFVALLALKDKMAAIDAEGAAKLMKEIRAIRIGTRRSPEDAQAPLAPRPDAHYAIEARHSGLCLDVAGDEIVQSACHRGASQQWRFVAAGGAYSLVSKQSGKCVDVEHASGSDGARIIQYPCVPQAPNQLFRLLPTADGGSSTLQATHSGRCLNVPRADMRPVPLIQYACTPGATNEQFRLVPVP